MSTHRTSVFAAIALFGCGCLGALGSAAAGGGNIPDDGWRRTADGWERIEQLQRPESGNPDGEYAFSPARPGRIFRIHPLALAVLQLSVVLAAYCLSPVPANGGEIRINPLQYTANRETLSAA
jgi:hypothetical protein